MPQKKRPTQVLVVAIIDIIFGALSLLNTCCLGSVILGGLALLNSAAGTKEVEALKKIFTIMNDNVPGLVTFLVISLSLELILGIVLLIAGIGLLKMHNWARTTALVWAVLAIILQIGTGAYAITVMNPGMAKAQEEIKREIPQQGNVKGNPFGDNLTNSVSQIIGMIIGVALAATNLIILLMPKTVAAFAAPEQGEAPDPYRKDFDDDFDYGRRPDDFG